MKNYGLYAVLMVTCAVLRVEAYSFTFHNAVSKNLTVSMRLAGGDSSGTHITVPAAPKASEGSGARGYELLGHATQGFDNVLCLAVNDLFVGENNKSMKKVVDSGDIWIMYNCDYNTFISLVFDPAVAISTLRSVMGGNKPQGTSAQWRSVKKSGDLILCGNRTFAIFEIDGKIALVTWE